MTVELLTMCAGYLKVCISCNLLSSYMLCSTVSSAMSQDSHASSEDIHFVRSCRKHNHSNYCNIIGNNLPLKIAN